MIVGNSGRVVVMSVAESFFKCQIKWNKEIKFPSNFCQKCSAVKWNLTLKRQIECDEPDSSIPPGHQLILFYRENGECIEYSPICDKTENDGEYITYCKYTLKSLSDFYSQPQDLG